MLYWFRIRASRIAALATVALTTAVGSSIMPHEDDCHDAACRPIAVEHDASAHRITIPDGADSHAPHCLACHWARSFRPRPESRILPTPAAEAGITVHVEYFTAAVSAPVAQPPLRSPPSSPALS
jgi:hypothetical protein